MVLFEYNMAEFMFSMICWGKPAETKLCFPRTLWFNEEKEHFPWYLGAGGGQGFFSFLNFYLLLEYTWLMMLCEFQVYHSIIQLYIYTKVKVLAAQSCLTLLWPHELWPTRLLRSMGFSRQENWNGEPISRGSSWPRDRTQVPSIRDRFFTTWAAKEAPF